MRGYQIVPRNTDRENVLNLQLCATAPCQKFILGIWFEAELETWLGYVAHPYPNFYRGVKKGENLASIFDMGSQLQGNLISKWSNVSEIYMVHWEQLGLWVRKFPEISPENFWKFILIFP